MKRILSVLLAVVIGLGVSLNVFAASSRKTYISGLVAVTAKDEADAAAQLEKAGYKLLSGSNVNSSLNTAVFIGYKETEYADEAITDIAAMNMNGKFNYSDYKAIMESNREKIKETIDGFLPVIAEFQANYEEGRPSALGAYEAMNAFKDDDSGSLMGDYLVAFDFSEEAEKQLTETFMQANPQIVLSIMQQASFAGDDGDDSLFDRLQKTGPNGIEKKYRGMYPTVAKARQAMAAEYGDTAEEILLNWNSVYDYILKAEEELAPVDKNGEMQLSEEIFAEETGDKPELGEEIEVETKEYIEGMYAASKAGEVTADVIDYSLYNLLNITEYGDGTLLDFFRRPESEVKAEELYPFVDSMSEGQRTYLSMNGLKNTLLNAFNGIEEGEQYAAESVELVSDVAESFGTTSIYSGIDRSVFDEGIAFTSAATEHEKLSGESWTEKLLHGEGAEAEALRTMVISLAVTGTLIATFVTALLVCRVYENGRFPAFNEFAAMKNFTDGYVKSFKGFTEETAYKIIDGEKYKTVAFQEVEKAVTANRDKAYNTYWKMRDYHIGEIAQLMRFASFVLLIIAVASDISSIIRYINVSKPTEEAIPHHLLTTAVTPYGEDYVYYETVKNLKGEAQDTNNHEADPEIGWLMLYTTKDKAAGDPILSENLRVQLGSADFSADISFIHLFNETAALNLTDEKYTGKTDKANGTFITFSRASSVFIGSAITGGNLALFGIGGLAVGFGIGALIAKLTGKKKKETPVNA